MKVYVVVEVASCEVRVFESKEVAKGFCDGLNWASMMDGGWMPVAYCREAEVERSDDE